MQRVVLEDVDTGAEVLDDGPAATRTGATRTGAHIRTGAGHVQGEERGSVADQDPRRVVVRGTKPRDEFLDGRTCVPVLRESQGELAP